MGKKTIFDKIWDKHLVHEEEGRPTLLYIDLHLSIRRQRQMCIRDRSRLWEKKLYLIKFGISI